MSNKARAYWVYQAKMAQESCTTEFVSLIDCIKVVLSELSFCELGNRISVSCMQPELFSMHDLSPLLKSMQIIRDRYVPCIEVVLVNHGTDDPIRPISFHNFC